ncbi:hypothetical protein PGUG_01312 [Meyerozyma guilliermondii ATCC 6260]|uniref:Cullin family profile domain-containing protein n=1 Tax=Meyerozyma guilliermondii (strain ATCC 6260 / CBS 566 / DSM 6381 / JCM 1539 / NBRC 10279 / NRRL Y-324) TaxID=294746 RepID=A5DDG1_PICGU|nr:uncharacterized protein PGUG_01312 [Meyerozyma guilliermondii ATCC 6260]EDK37214.2 hypothetical protein PGUG_01312 [Meyerozyma guilliermondii ATCC 6260]
MNFAAITQSTISQSISNTQSRSTKQRQTTPRNTKPKVGPYYTHHFMDVRTILRVYDLHDLASSVSDIENDVALLLEWLNPASSPPLGPAQPSPRVKAAIRRCLKDQESQVDFIRLYANSLRSSVPGTLETASEAGNFDDLMALVDTYVSYFRLCIDYLGLEQAATQIFYRSLRAMFRAGLLSQKSSFSKMLSSYLEKNLVIPSATSPEAHKKIQLLAHIGMSEEVAALVTSLAINRIRNYVRSTCAGVWDRPVLQNLNRWVESQLHCFHTIDPSFAPLHHLVKVAHTELVSTRIIELFNLVAAYPHSSVALQELHECVSSTGESAAEKSSHRAKLVDAFIEQCNQKLLHSGANTVEVITTYAATIRSFLVIDPKGVLLDKVVRPIRRYLKGREDIIITLVHGLLDDGEANPLHELARELRRGSSVPVQVGDEDMSQWMPDPIDALPDFKKGKVTDIIESLISIFDSKDIFISEFTQIFGNRLINLHDYDTSPIQQQLDLLKLKFGTEEFSTLDVMIRDVINSRQTNTDISGNLPFHSLILSHMYWTSVSENISDVDHFDSSHLKSYFETYNDKFKKNKRGRSLELVPSLGQVTLEIETQGSTQTFSVSPSEAAVVLEFGSNVSQLSIADICSRLNMQQYPARTALDAWVKRGVLVEKSPDVFTAVD